LEIFPHNDMAALEMKLLKARASAPGARRLIVVDGVYSMDADMAPLPELVNLAEKYESVVMVDEAHATGTLGPGGRGLAAHFGLTDKVHIIMGTLSKALGSVGGFVAGNGDLVKFLVNHSRSFIFSTALPPPAVAAALESLAILEENPALPEKLQSNAVYVRDRLTDLGFNTMQAQSHMTPVMIGDAARTMEMASRLFSEGVLVSALRPPTVPKDTSRLRVSVMVNHTREDLDFALNAFEKAGRALKII
jgi:7-keto-8-aminopelargonate synthetase-like enzyme